MEHLFQKRILTLDETSIYTGWSKSKLHKLTSSGEIPHSKPTGKTCFIDRLELEAWLMSKRKKTHAERQQIAANHITNLK